MSKFRKFEVINVTLSPGGPGPERMWVVKYKAIVRKQWKEGTLNIIARTAEQARQQAINRFSKETS